jgi:hypothetical protein
MTKLQISLTDQETQLLSMRAAVLGYDVTKYAKFVLAQDAVEQLTSPIPTFKATPKMEKIIKKGLKEYRQGKTKTWVLGKYDDSRN